MTLALSSRRNPRAAIGNPETGTVKIWDLVADKNIRTLQVAKPNELAGVAVPTVILNPNGDRLVTLKNDTTMEIWDVATGQRLLTLPGPANVDAADLRFTPDGRWLAIADCTGKLVMYDATTGERRLTFSQTQCTQSIALSPDEKLLALIDARRRLILKEFETGRELVTIPLPADTNVFSEVRFTPDGTRLIVSLDDGTVRMYLVKLEDIVALAKTRVTRSLTTEECKQYLHVEACP
jgi:WD40 repeat protein